MSDCVYLAWRQAAKDLGIKPQEGSRQLFELARSLFGEPDGLWGGAAPLVLGLLCHMHGLTLVVSCHPWFNKAYYRAVAATEWQRWAVTLWRSRGLWQELAARPEQSSQKSRGLIYFWLGGHHAYYALDPVPRRLTIMTIRLYRQKEGDQDE